MLTITLFAFIGVVDSVNVFEEPLATNVSLTIVKVPETVEIVITSILALLVGTDDVTIVLVITLYAFFN